MSRYVLIHHGIEGQKWGVRRYQNEDGTLTEEGKKRYRKALDDDVKKIIEIENAGRELYNEAQRIRKPVTKGENMRYALASLTPFTDSQSFRKKMIDKYHQKENVTKILEEVDRLEKESSNTYREINAIMDGMAKKYYKNIDEFCDDTSLKYKIKSRKLFLDSRDDYDKALKSLNKRIHNTSVYKDNDDILIDIKQFNMLKQKVNDETYDRIIRDLDKTWPEKVKAAYVLNSDQKKYINKAINSEQKYADYRNSKEAELYWLYYNSLNGKEWQTEWDKYPSMA